jgi:hypothetical protein
MAVERKYNSQLGAGLGMISETIELLRLWQPGDGPASLVKRAVEEGIFSRATAYRTRNLVVQMFAPRFMRDGGAAAFRLKSLLERRFAHESLVQLFYLYTCRYQAVLFDFIVSVYWPKYSAGAPALNKEDARAFLLKAQDTGRAGVKWSESVTDHVARYVVGSCIDFGLLGEGTVKHRPFLRYVLRSEAALYLAHDLHFSGLGDQAILAHPDWKLFGLEPAEVAGVLAKLGNDGHLVIQSAADLVQISWKYQTMEECLNALTER